MSHTTTACRLACHVTRCSGRMRVASLVGNVFVEGSGEEHGNAKLEADGEEGHMLQRQPTASMRLATGVGTCSQSEINTYA